MLEISRRPPTALGIPRGHRPFCPAPAILPLKKGKRMGREKIGNPCKQRLWLGGGVGVLPGAGGRGEGRGRRGPEERAMRVP